MLDLLHTFEDFAGCGVAAISTYSGGIGPGFFEDTLIFMDADGDDGQSGGGAPFVASLDAAGYADPSDVYIGFWYSTHGGTYCWSYAIDNVMVSTVIPGPVVFEEDFEGDMTGWETCTVTSGDYWHYTDLVPIGFSLYGVDPDCDDIFEGVPCHPTDDEFWVVSGYPTYDMGLNNALDIKVCFPTECETWSAAWYTVRHTGVAEPGTAAYIEVSTDDGATWIPMWSFENFYEEEICPYGSWGASCAPNPRYGTYVWQCMVKEIDLLPYIEAGLDCITIRFRYTTLGNECCSVSQYPAYGGWAIDALELQVKIATFTDEQAPLTVAVYDAEDCEVSLFANDPGMHATGVAATYYKLGGGAQQTYTGPIDIPDGETNVEFWSVDNAGNEESHKSETFVCDKEPPEIEITEPLEGLYLFGSRVLQNRIIGSGALCIGPVTIKADASDSVGVAMVTFEIEDDTGYDTSSPYEYRYRGRHFGEATVTATAIDDSGRTAEDSATFTIYSLGLM
jgi:hypothetical protein